MAQEKRDRLSNIFKLMWQFIKKNGMSMSEALRMAWANVKLKARMCEGIVKFYFRKVDGSMREAYGTLKIELMPIRDENVGRKKNDTVQTYYDTERCEYRCFKRANLVIG